MFIKVGEFRLNLEHIITYSCSPFNSSEPNVWYNRRITFYLNLVNTKNLDY
jgi:hypothetical protein